MEIQKTRRLWCWPQNFRLLPMGEDSAKWSSPTKRACRSVSTSLDFESSWFWGFYQMRFGEVCYPFQKTRTELPSFLRTYPRGIYILVTFRVNIKYGPKWAFCQWLVFSSPRFSFGTLVSNITQSGLWSHLGTPGRLVVFPMVSTISLLSVLNLDLVARLVFRNDFWCLAFGWTYTQCPWMSDLLDSLCYRTLGCLSETQGGSYRLQWPQAHQ